MEFCPKCRSLMIPSGGVLKCRKCGFEKKPAASEAVIVGAPEKPGREMTILEGKEDAGLPTTDEVKCPECGNQKAYWWMRQLRSADESEVRFFRCTQCGKTWREYN